MRTEAEIREASELLHTVVLDQTKGVFPDMKNPTVANLIGSEVALDWVLGQPSPMDELLPRAREAFKVRK